MKLGDNIIPSHPLSIRQWAFVPPMYLPEYRDRLIIIVFPQWPGSFSDPCSVVINWFFQFIYYSRCYPHLSFSTFITDEANVVCFVLELIPRVHSSSLPELPFRLSSSSGGTSSSLDVLDFASSPMFPSMFLMISSKSSSLTITMRWFLSFGH